MAATALVGLGGVRVAVAENDAAGGESWLNDLGDGLGAVGEHKGEFGCGRDGTEGGLGFGVEEDGADAVAEGGSAGLAESDDGVSLGFERGGETAELGGFARAVETFEGEEEAVGHELSLSQGDWLPGGGDELIEMGWKLGGKFYFGGVEPRVVCQ